MEITGIVVTMALVICVICYICRKQPVDKKVYHYAAGISEGMKDGPFRKVRQEVTVRKKCILFKGYLNERYAIVRANRGDNYTEYVCKNKANSTCLLLFDTDHRTGVVINSRQAGILFSSDEPTHLPHYNGSTGRYVT
jgi:hypothetical protein